MQAHLAVLAVGMALQGAAAFSNAPAFMRSPSAATHHPWKRAPRLCSPAIAREKGTQNWRMGENPTDKKDKVFDLVVVGGGPTGLTAALTAASVGRTVALVDKTPKVSRDRDRDSDRERDRDRDRDRNRDRDKQTDRQTDNVHAWCRSVSKRAQRELPRK